MRQIQIPYELFILLLRCHLLEDGTCEADIRKELEKKVDTLRRHELYTKYKTAPTQEEQERARQEYLDKCGILGSFRW